MKRPQIGLIVARDLNNLIGINDTIPWRYPADFKRFKRVTMDGTCIMGSKTWESIPNGLPGREKIVLSRDLSKYSNIKVTNDIVAALELAFTFDRPIWVIGGKSIYDWALSKIKFDVVDITTIPQYTDIKDQKNPLYFSYDPILEKRAKYSKESEVNQEDPRLIHTVYTRIY